MRELTQKVQFLKGIGPRLAALFEKMGVVTVADLLRHAPRQYEDRREITPLARAAEKDRAHVLVEVVAHDYVGFGRKRTLKVFIRDASGVAALVCFGRQFLEKVLLPGGRFFISGTFSRRRGDIQATSFDYLTREDYERKPEKVFPFYPLTEGLTQKTVQKAVERALDRFAPEIEDELPADLIRQYGFPPKSEAVRTVHFPRDHESLERCRRSLIYEELFYLELVILRRALERRIKRVVRPSIRRELAGRLLERLPFRLTPDQERARDEIEHDLFSDFPLLRLLQGDVGSGKTLVALFAALAVIEAGEQAAFMAPTELLARQHAAYMAALVEPLGVRTALLSGSLDAGARGRLLTALAAGEIDLLIGTHALFSADVSYRKLGLVIIDEQHRFGVLQRRALLEKGPDPDLLLMTATPIPRSLALTAFGDLDSSLLRTKPPGRRPVITHLTRRGNEGKVYDRVKEELAAGRQAYFIYPLIEESEKVDVKNAVAMFEHLSREIFAGYRVGLIHSRLEEEEKRWLDWSAVSPKQPDRSLRVTALRGALRVADRALAACDGWRVWRAGR